MNTIMHNGYKILIKQDSDPMNPREEFDNLGTMICFHSSYILGDKHSYKSSDYKGWEDLKRHIIAEVGPIETLPLYLLDHSGLTINTSGFKGVDPQGWDWGCVGFIYVSHAQAKKEYNWKQITKARIKFLQERLQAEVETYDDLLTGNVYGYVIETPDGEEADSCWGYYGDPEKSGLVEDAKSVIEATIKHKVMTEGVQLELALS